MNWFCFILTITLSLVMVVANNEINNNEKCRQISGNFNHHVDATLQCGAHHPMEHIQDFTRSHWIPPLGKCLHPIALLVAMVDDFGCKYKNTKKTQLIASNLWYNQP
jgi:hypothetical protein